MFPAPKSLKKCPKRARSSAHDIPADFQQQTRSDGEVKLAGDVEDGFLNPKLPERSSSSSGIFNEKPTDKSDENRTIELVSDQPRGTKRAADGGDRLDNNALRPRLNLPMGSVLAQRFPQHAKRHVPESSQKTLSNKRRRTLPFKRCGASEDL